MTKFNSNILNASDELIVSKYLTKYASDNNTVFTLTNKVVVDSYLNEAKKLLEVFNGNQVIVDFIDLLENIEERKTEPTAEVSEEA